MRIQGDSLSENSELTAAAATGAAAAVAAVQDDQAEQERAASMEAATVDASISAEVATEQAQEAAQTAQEAAAIALEASQEASVAGDTAAVAAGEAYSAQADIAQLREEMTQGWQSFRTDMTSFLDERLGSSNKEQPTEVVVQSDRTDSPAQQHDNPGGDGSTGDNGPRRRHKFGRR